MEAGRLVETTLREVSVYREGFVARRTGVVELEQGRNQVYLAGATALTVASSLRLRLSGEVRQGQIRLVDEVPGVDGMLPQDREALDAAHALQDEVAELEAELKICATEAELWEKNGSFGYAAGGVTLVDAVAYMERLPQRLREIEGRRRELAARLKLKNAELDEHLRRSGIRRRAPWDDAPRPDVTIAPLPTVCGAAPASAEFVVERDRNARYVFAELIAAQAGTYEVELESWRPGATWEPLYEAHATDAQKIEVRLRARVTQTTKEDWRQVRVTLRNGRPSLAGGVPAFEPWYVDLRSNVAPSAPPTAKRALAAGSYATPAPSESGAFVLVEDDLPFGAPPQDGATNGWDARMVRVGVLEAQRRDHQALVEYELPGVWDVPSGVEGQLVDLACVEAPAQLHCYAFPALDGAVYLAASIEDAPAAFPLSGEVSSYMDGAFVGTCHVDAAKAADEGLELSFGRTDRVHAKRRQTGRHTAPVALRNAMRTSFSYEIEVVNAGSEDVEVMVVDQVPVARDPSIVVEVDVGGSAQVDPATGKVEWTLNLGPAEHRTLTLAYTVTYPKKDQVIGL